MVSLRIRANRGLRKTMRVIQKLSGGRLVNIDSNAEGVSGTLSNFTRGPFTLDGKNYESFEGFWQGLKFPEGSNEREKARTLSGITTKRISNGVSGNHLYYGGRKIPYNSWELYKLAKRAEQARFRQNPDHLAALLSTNRAKLVHLVEWKDSRSLPRRVFCKILTEIREEERAKQPRRLR